MSQKDLNPDCLFTGGAVAEIHCVGEEQPAENRGHGPPNKTGGLRPGTMSTVSRTPSGHLVPGRPVSGIQLQNIGREGGRERLQVVQRGGRQHVRTCHQLVAEQKHASVLRLRRLRGGQAQVREGPSDLPEVSGHQRHRSHFSESLEVASS